MSIAPATPVEAIASAKDQAGPHPNARLNVEASAQPVKILHVINDLGIGGAEMMLYRLLAHKDRARFDPVVVSLMDRGPLRERIEALGVPVCTASMRAGVATPQSIWRFIGLVRQIEPDLIQGWLYHGCLAAQIAKFVLPKKTPVIWSIHCSVYPLTFEKKATAAVFRLCALMSRLASRIIFVSRTSKAQHEKLSYRMEHACVIPNGIDEDVFAPSDDARLSVRSELGLKPDALLVGTIGRYHRMKDHANFLRAAAQIVKRNPDVHFFLAGRGLTAENRDIVQLIDELNLNQRIHLLGERHDIARLVAALDVFCLSSAHSESFPLIVGEAMSCGVPCVVTDIGDLSWMVGETGTLVQPRDPISLADSCAMLLDSDAQARRALGQAARSRVMELFSLSSVVAKYEELYETTVSPDQLKLQAPARPVNPSVEHIAIEHPDN